MTAEVDIRKYKRHLKYQRVVRRSPLPLSEVARAWRPLRGLVIIALVLVVLVFILSGMSRAAERESSSAALPDAPSVGYIEMQAVPAAPQSHDNRLARVLESKQAYRASQWFLIGATAVDAVVTYRGLTHPTHLTGSYYVPDPGLWIYPNVDLTRQFSEGGWARFAGPRNAGGVVAANVALNAGVLLLSHELAKKGPRWRAVAMALNSAKAAGSVSAAAGWAGVYGYANSLPAKWVYPVQTLSWKP